MDFNSHISQQLNIPLKSINSVLELIQEGATVPFIARYRKDQTGGLDETQIITINDTFNAIKQLHERKLYIIKSITDQNKMTEELQSKIDQCTDLNSLEDLYLPYKPKKRTKAQIARENGLEPLADLILTQSNIDIHTEAEKYINEKVTDIAAALNGAKDIIAESINENAEWRAAIRNIFEQNAILTAKVVSGQEEPGAKYKDYFDYNENIKTIPSHRILAILRGFMEGVLRMSIEPDEEMVLGYLEKNLITAPPSSSSDIILKAIKDAYKRLIQPSLENEFRQLLKTKADEEAIQVFADNLKQLLLSSPLGSKRIIAIDPGYRTGCKVVVLDEKGDLKHHDVIYIHEKNHKLIEAEKTIRDLYQKYDIEAFAIGDGTAGRETEMFIKSLQLKATVFLVNEDGASIYSASEIAREEFAEYDITVRGSVSIGRRLMDPLAELVKIDPKSIGVGQYQHDVNQTRLKEKLDQTVMSCVNLVGVNLNTSGKQLLSYVSGIGPSLAENIINYRRENGRFKNRKQLLEVPRLGQKAFIQSAGFLKIIDGDNVLDRSTVHPEAYSIVEKMAKDANVSIQDLMGNVEVLNTINPNNYISDDFGYLTIQDIINELKKPGLDPRSEIQNFEFANIYSIEDVVEGMIVPGIVTNLTKFGAFVDIGVKQDGLVHVSEIAHHYISDPAEVLKLNDKVQVKVTEVDKVRKRIGLSIKATQEKSNAPSKPTSKPKSNNNPSTPKNSWLSSLDSLKSKFSK